MIGCVGKENAQTEIIPATSTNRQTQEIIRQSAVISRTNPYEHQVLVRLAQSIEELEALIVEAENSTDPDARIRFDYYQLRVDMLSIVRGIKAHIRTPVYTPRTLEPIVGNYGR